MKIRILFWLSLLVLLFQNSRAQETPPNIVLIITDQHSGTLMNQRGYPYIQTPGIDKIAEQGVAFTRAYCAYPVCTSSRKSIHTGLMPERISSPTDHPSIGKTMQEAGYETAFFGKWHVGSTKIDEVKDWHGFQTYEHGHDDTRIEEVSINFLRQEHTKPFLLWTSFQNPHDCCDLARIMTGIPDSFHDGPVDGNMDTAFCPPLPSNFAIPENEAEGFYGRREQEPGDKYWETHPTTFWSDARWRQYMYGYDRLVEKVDAHIEKIYDELDSLDLLENTMVIYTADHGDGHASHKWNQKKTFYEEAVNIPFILSWKGKTSAGIIDKETLINNGLDLYPTILRAAGLAVPGSLHGINLNPNALLDAGGDTAASREYIVAEINQKIYKGMTPGTFYGRMLVAGNLKYILFDRGVNREQLFDLEADPGELKPVNDNPAYKDILDSCRLMLKEWIDSSGDDFNVEAYISQYESEAGLNGIFLNGTPLAGFSPARLSYTAKLERTDSVRVTALPVNSAAGLTISQAGDIWGDVASRTATIEVVSEDSSTVRTYTVILDVSANATSLELIKQTGSGISVYPNPASDFISVKSVKDPIIDIGIYSPTGQELLFHRATSNINEISVSGLKTGLYVLRIKTLTGIRNFKFIKE